MQQQGFSLIELMIVVAIIGILAMLAIPAYQVYTVRARVSEAMGFAAVAKTSVSETMIANGGIAPTNNEEAGYTFAGATENVKSVVVGSNGIITITTTALAGNGSFSLTPTYSNGQISWTCQHGSLEPRYLPANCRAS